ncbi:MAG: arginine--tRNA ligase [Candidatus Dormiibacterota bacterium]
MPDLESSFAQKLAAAARDLGAPDVGQVAVAPSALEEVGDFSSPIAFRLAGQLRRPPSGIAEELAAALRLDPPPHTAEVTVSGGGYVNLRIDFAAYAGEVVREALERGPVISPDPDAGAKVVVEHTATNPNKAAHVGHLRNACIGDTVARLLRARGHPVEVQNYIDDTGVQVADVLVGIRELGLTPQEGEPFDRFCSRAYVEVFRRYEVEPHLLELRRETLRQIESRKGAVADEAKELTSRIVDAHLRTMARAGVAYDLLTWESDIIELGFLRHALDLLKERGVTHKAAQGPLAGCWVLPVEEGAQDPETGEAKVLIKSDGIATYTAKDIAYHLWKFGLLGLDFRYRPWSASGPATSTADPLRAELPPERFGHAARVVNVIDQRQSAPQRVVKEALRRLGFTTQAEALFHLAYEVVALSPRAAIALGVETEPGRTMYALSGRRGIEVGADDLLDEAERLVRPKARDQRTAELLAASAVRYYLLRFGLNSIINFDFEEALRTSGDTGVYLQYAHARACGILRRVEPLPAPSRVAALAPEGRRLVKQIAAFPGAVEEAARSLSPSALAGYTFQLATAFNDYYEHTDRLFRVEDPALRGQGRALVDALRATLGRSLELLGMQPLERI